LVAAVDLVVAVVLVVGEVAREVVAALVAVAAGRPEVAEVEQPEVAEAADRPEVAAEADGNQPLSNLPGNPAAEITTSEHPYKSRDYTSRNYTNPI